MQTWRRWWLTPEAITAAEPCRSDPWLCAAHRDRGCGGWPLPHASLPPLVRLPSLRGHVQERAVREEQEHPAGAGPGLQLPGAARNAASWCVLTCRVSAAVGRGWPGVGLSASGEISPCSRRPLAELEDSTSREGITSLQRVPSPRSRCTFLLDRPSLPSSLPHLLLAAAFSPLPLHLRATSPISRPSPGTRSPAINSA